MRGGKGIYGGCPFLGRDASPRHINKGHINQRGRQEWCLVRSGQARSGVRHRPVIASSLERQVPAVTRTRERRNGSLRLRGGASWSTAGDAPRPAHGQRREAPLSFGRQLREERSVAQGPS